jgi:uncharacterized protein (DUF2267 family)
MFYRRVIDETGLGDRELVKRGTREARAMVVTVFAALKAQISPGEADDVSAELPQDLREVSQEA